MKDTTGFLVPESRMNCAACSSALPPISPIMMMPSVSGSLTKRSCTRSQGQVLRGHAGGDVVTRFHQRCQPPWPQLYACRAARRSHQAVNKIGPVEGVAADADDSGLAEALGGRLVHGLVREGARPRHDADFSRRVDVARHDADFARIGLDDPCTHQRPSTLRATSQFSARCIRLNAASRDLLLGTPALYSASPKPAAYHPPDCDSNDWHDRVSQCPSHSHCPLRISAPRDDRLNQHSI